MLNGISFPYFVVQITLKILAGGIYFPNFPKWFEIVCGSLGDIYYARDLVYAMFCVSGMRKQCRRAGTAPENSELFL